MWIRLSKVLPTCAPLSLEEHRVLPMEDCAFEGALPLESGLLARPVLIRWCGGAKLEVLFP